MHNGLNWPLVTLLIAAIAFCTIISAQLLNFGKVRIRECGRTERLRMEIAAGNQALGLVAADARAAHPSTVGMAAAIDRTARRAAATAVRPASVVPAGVKAGETSGETKPPWIK